MAHARRVLQFMLLLGLVSAAAVGADSRADRIDAWIGDATLIKTMLHPDGTVEKTYEAADGGSVQVVYRPDGRIDLFGDPASIDYEPPAPELAEAPPFGVWLEESESSQEMAPRIYSKLGSLVPPKHDFAIEATASDPIPEADFDKTVLASLLTLEPVRQLVVTPSTLALTIGGEYAGSRATWEVRWSDEPRQHLPEFPPEIESVDDFLAFSAVNGEVFSRLELREIVPLIVHTSFAGEIFDYRAAATRWRTQDGRHVLWLMDETVGDALHLAHEEIVQPLHPDDLDRLPAARSLLLELGVQPTPLETSKLFKHDGYPDPPTDLCCKQEHEQLWFTQLPAASQYEHNDGRHEARVSFSLRCQCYSDCMQTAETSTPYYRSGTVARLCKDSGDIYNLFGTTHHRMQESYETEYTNSFGAIDFLNTASARVAYMCGMERCTVFCGADTSFGIDFGFQAAISFSSSDTDDWLYKKPGLLECPPCTVENGT